MFPVIITANTILIACPSSWMAEMDERAEEQQWPRSYFIFSSPWSQINCVIDWRESSNGALAQQSLGRPSPSGAEVRFPHSQSGRGS